MSQAFRVSSEHDSHATQSMFDTFDMSVRTYSKSHNVSLSEARKQVIPGYDDDRWNLIRLEGYDSKVGDTITSSKVSVCCNSLFENQLYNDTFAVGFKKFLIPGDDSDVTMFNVTYNKMNSPYFTHSGDEFPEYGLRHRISILDDIDTTYILSAAWNKSKPRPLSTLDETKPILEIRTEDEDENNQDQPTILKRYILPQDYGRSGDSTACVNAKITYDKDTKKYTVTLCRDFIKGFADDIKTVSNELGGGK